MVYGLPLTAFGKLAKSLLNDVLKEGPYDQTKDSPDS